MIVITPLLPRQKVKFCLKIGEHLPKLWAIKYQVVFFYKTRCIYMQAVVPFSIFSISTVQKHTQ